MEIFRLVSRKNEYLNREIEVSPVFVCRGLAKKIVQDKSKYTFAVGSEFDNKGSDIELHNIAFHKNKPDLKKGYKIKLKEKIDFNEIICGELSQKEKLITKNKALKIKI